MLAIKRREGKWTWRDVKLNQGKQHQNKLITWITCLLINWSLGAAGISCVSDLLGSSHRLPWQPSTPFYPAGEVAAGLARVRGLISLVVQIFFKSYRIRIATGRNGVHGGYCVLVY